VDLEGVQRFEACSAITADLVVIQTGADITFIAPSVELLNGFAVEVGATLTVINATPAACP